jgi:hypothetical protein
MNVFRSKFPRLGVSDDRVVWLDVCPPLQPELVDWPLGAAAAENGAKANPDLGAIYGYSADIDDQSRHWPRRTSRLADGPMRDAGSESDAADSVSHRERLELICSAASMGIGDNPSWLILVIEKEPAFEKRLEC